MAHTGNVALDWTHDLANGVPDLQVAQSRRWTLPLGALSSQANKVVRVSSTLAAAGTTSIDLNALSGPAAETISANRVHAIFGFAETAGATGSIAPHATNGWTGLGSAYAIPVSNGWFYWTSEAGVAVSGSNKVIELTNNSAASATFVFYFLVCDT